MVKTFLTVAFVLMMGFILIHRQRVFLRDPVATVYRNEVQQSGVRVFINYSNDVLLEQDIGDRATSRIMVQNWNQMPGTPARLTCMPRMACLTSDDHAPLNPIPRTGHAKYDPKTAMTSREISFVDGDGSHVRVKLR